MAESTPGLRWSGGARFARSLAALGCSAALSGCLPVHQTQYLPEAADADHLRADACDNADNAVRIVFHGIRITAGIWSKAQGGVHVAYTVPEGVTAQLATSRALLVAHTERGETSTGLSMMRMQVKRAAGATEPMAGASVVHHYLFGLRSSVTHAQFDFRAEPWGIDYGDSGTLTLPDLSIDGTLYPGPVIRYRRSRTFGWVLVGC
ncbi:MAG: hypothetical protein ISP90_01765 [Nevskia sp.]|nr:hypothetical protein [Nevskia sp.]